MKNKIQKIIALILVLLPVCGHGADFAIDYKDCNYYIADINSDGFSDVLVKPKGKFVMIDLEDIIFPVPIKGGAVYVLISNASGSYALGLAEPSVERDSRWIASSMDVVEIPLVNGDRDVMLRDKLGKLTGAIFISHAADGDLQDNPVRVRDEMLGIRAGDQNAEFTTDSATGVEGGVVVVRSENQVRAVLRRKSMGGYAMDADLSMQLIWQDFVSKVRANKVAEASGYFLTSEKGYLSAQLAGVSPESVFPDGVEIIHPVFVSDQMAEYFFLYNEAGFLSKSSLFFVKYENSWRISAI